MSERKETLLKSGLTSRVILTLLFVSLLIAPLDTFLTMCYTIRMLSAGPGYLIGMPALYIVLILFSELCRYYRKAATKQELFILYYIFPIAMTETYFIDLIYQGYLRTSPVARKYFIDPLTGKPIPLALPSWYAPPLGSLAYETRSFLHPDWLLPITTTFLALAFFMMTEIGLGLLAAHLFVDIEKLPFPTAPMDAEGIVTIAEREPTRVSVFSVSTLISLVWSAITFGVPTALGHFFGIRAGFLTFVDLTTFIDKYVPGAVFGFIFEPFAYTYSWLLPTDVVIWIFIGSYAIWLVGNHLALRVPSPYFEQFKAEYRIGTPAQWVMWRAMLDIWFSFIIGASFGVALIRILSGGKYLIRALRSLSKLVTAREAGLLPLHFILALLACGMIGSLVLIHYLVPGFPLWILIVFVIVIPFLNALLSARGLGEVGFRVSIPYMKELSIYLANYKGADIWFSPLYIRGYGQGSVAASYTYIVKVARLTDTNPLDFFKAIALVMPLTIGMSFLIVSLLWAMAPIPSIVYPATVTLWPELVVEQCFMATEFFRLFKPDLMTYGVIIMGIMTAASLKIPYVNAMALLAGFSTPPYFANALLIGHLLGKYLLERYFGKEWWNRYKAVILAGLACGYGLVAATVGVAALVTKALWYSYATY